MQFREMHEIMIALFFLPLEIPQSNFAINCVPPGAYTIANFILDISSSQNGCIRLHSCRFQQKMQNTIILRIF